jgi:hypothetical protein
MTNPAPDGRTPSPPDDHGDTDAEGARRTRDRDKAPRSELEDAAAGIGRALGGVMTQLFGTGVTGIEPPTGRPVISTEADDAIDRGGARLGQWLHGAGEALAHHPLDPARVVDDASRIRQEPMPSEAGLTPLSIGLRSLAGGLYKTAEAVLDQVAPRKQKTASDGNDMPEGDAPPADDTTATSSPEPDPS